MQEVLKERFPPDITDIIVGYVEIFKHPVAYGACAVCRVPVKWYTNLCKLHSNICALCLDFAEVDYNYICKTCEGKYDTHTWMLYVTGATNGDVFSAFYRDDEIPIDIAYLSAKVRKLQTIRDQFEEIHDLAVNIWVDLEDNPNPHPQLAKRQYDKAWALTEIKAKYQPKIKPVTSLIRKL